MQALTGTFPKTKDEHIPSAPLELVKCMSGEGCGLVQLRHSYEIGELYGDNYGYRSGLNASMVKHLQAKIKKVIDSFNLKSGDLIVDIGSNDGTSLSSYPADKFELVGFEPIGKKFEQYYPERIRLIPDFFSANRFQKELPGKHASVITSFSMFYDLEDPTAFMRDIESCLSEEGVWVFEQSYLPSMLRTNSFDTICHEHLEFYSLKQINWMAENAGLKILDVDFNDINGGSFSITAAKTSSNHKVQTEKLKNIFDDEIGMGLDTLGPWKTFEEQIAKERNSLVHFLEKAAADGKSVYGLGASTKGNVLLQHFEINEQLLQAIGEVNKDKFGSFTPGTHIPLIPEDEVLGKNPDFLLVLPWHFKEFFLSLPKLKGKTLVFPLPKFEVVTI